MFSIGIPKDTILQYEDTLKADGFLVLVQGTADEVKHAHEILNTSKRTVWRLARIGKIQRIKLGHRSTRFRLEDFANITSVDGSILTPGQALPL